MVAVASLEGPDIKLSRALREASIVGRTVIAFQQVIVVAFFSINLMQAFSLSTDGSLVRATKTPEVQNENFRIFEVTGEILSCRQVGSTHSC